MLPPPEPVLALGMPSPQELLVVLLILVLLFGARRLPELARSLGKSITEFKRGKDEGERELSESSKDPEGDDSSSPSA